MDSLNTNFNTDEIKDLFKTLIYEVKSLKEGTQNNISRLLSFEETMKILGVAKTTLYGLVSKQEIPCVRIDRHIRFEQKNIEKFIQEKKKEKFNFQINIRDLKGKKYLKKPIFEKGD